MGKKGRKPIKSSERKSRTITLRVDPLIETCLSSIGNKSKYIRQLILDDHKIKQ